MAARYIVEVAAERSSSPNPAASPQGRSQQTGRLVRKVGMSMAQPGVVAPWRATYVPGDWYVIAGPTSLVLLEPGPGRAEMIADLWADVVASSSMTDLVDRLAGYGITELPDLAVVFWSSAGMRSLVRGGVRLVDPGSEAQVASGTGVLTWNEVGLEKVTRVRIGVGETSADGESLPLAVGVVRAGAVLLSAEDDAAVRSPQPLLRAAASRVVDGSATAGAVGPADAAGVAAATGAADSVPPDSEAGDQAPGSEQREGPVPEPSTASEESADDTGPDFPAVDTGDDHEPQTGESPMVGLDSPWGPQAGAGALAGAASVGAAGAAGAGAAGAGAGGAGGAAAAGPGGVAGTAGSARVAGHDDETPTEFSIEQFEMENDDTQLMANPIPVGPGGPSSGAGSTAQTEPLVEAVRCPNGHPNAPGSTVCRICRSTIPARPPELVPKPLLARLRAADGTVVDLDRAILFGRAPSESRSTVSLPRLVTLASPAQDISRTHLQVVPDDWQILATDLNSTNGTFVTDPGPAGNRGLLPPGQPTPVPIGAVMELGEGVTLTVEPAD
jgi:hypothetical protein